MSLIIKPYNVYVAGFGDHLYYATSPGKARADAWRSYSEAYGGTFKEFLQISKVTKAKAPDRFGEPCSVGGKPAYFVPDPQSRQGKRFVYPNKETVLSTHDNDFEWGWPTSHERDGE